MICCSTIVRYSCAKANDKLQLVAIALALFVCLMLMGCRTKRSTTSAVVASATIGTMESALMDSSYNVVQWDVYVIDTIKDTASWVPMVRKTIATKRHALANARTDAQRKDTATMVEQKIPHGAHAVNTDNDIMQLSPLQLLLYKIGMIVCIFVLFFGISYASIAYFRKNS